MAKLLRIEGQGGGKKGGGGKSASNTLRSKATVKLVFLVSEGEIDFIDQLYIDGTPLIAADGTPNFKGVKWEFRPGLPDQSYFPSAPFVETPFQVETEVKKQTGQVIRTVAEENADAVRVIMRIPALFSRSEKDGSLQPWSVSYVIKVRSFGGQFEVAHYEGILNQKNTSPVQLQHEVRLPPGGAPWAIAVERLIDDERDEEKATSTTIWESYTTVVEGRFTYPNSAVVYVEIDAEQFGTGTPTITFGGRGMKTPVPSNYDPVSRTYSGLWDGTFRTRWHNNPVWVLWDLITNDRYGIGEFVNVDRLDKMSFYKISQYCDGLVPAGYDDDNGNAVMEPRYKFDGTINTRDEAFNLLRSVANVFRGTTYWSLGQVFAVADMPADAVQLVTPSNVHKGEFEFSGVSLDALHSAALVSWNDPDDLGRPATELVINDEVLNQFGWREIEVPLLGVTSRGQALRAGLWTLDTEQYQDETIVYGADWDHAQLKPFDIIAVATEQKAGYRTGGRVVSATRRVIEVDAPIDFTPGVAYRLKLVLPDGTIENGDIQSAVGGTVITLTKDLAAAPIPDSVWIVTSLEAQQRRYRVLTIEEEDPGFFKITAVFHDPNKYARVELGINLPKIRYTRPSRTIKPPTNLAARENKYFENTVPKSGILLSWSPGDDFMSKYYTVNVSGPRGRATYDNIETPSVDIPDVVQGQYSFAVFATGYNGLVSEPATLDFYASSWDGSNIPYVADLRLSTGGTEFLGQNPEFLWTPVFPDGTSGTNNPFFAASIVKMYDARVDPPVLLRTERLSTDRYVYSFDLNMADTKYDPARVLLIEVTVEDTLGRPSLPASLTVQNPPPLAPIVEAQAGFNSITIYWEQQANDLDLAGGDVHISLELEQPNLANRKYHGSGAFFVFMAEEYRPHYIQVGLYDSFSDIPVNYSTPIVVTPIVSVADFEPPARPTGFTYTTELSPDGMALVTFRWNANLEEDFAAYEIRVNEDGGGFVTLQTPELEYTIKVRPGAHIIATLTALDKSFNRSLRSLQTLDFIAAVDTVAPVRVEGLRVDAAFNGVWLTWDENVEPDLAQYEIYESTDGVDDTPPIAATSPAYVATAPSFARFGLETGEARFYAVRAVDTSGNEGEWSELVRGAALDVDFDVTAEAIDRVFDRTEYAQSIVVPVRVNALPLPITDDTPQRVFLSTDGRIYKPNAMRTAWVDEGDATQIKGQFTTAQIAAGAIKAEQIAAGAVSAASLFLGDTTNLAPNGDFTAGIAGFDTSGDVSVVSGSDLPPNGPGIYAAKLGTGANISMRGLALSSNAEYQRLGIEALAGEEFRFELWLYADTGGQTERFLVYNVSADGDAVPTEFTTATPIVAKTWTRIVGTYAAPTSGRLFVAYEKPADSGAATYVTRLRATRRNAGELVVDGSITANMVTAINLITLSSQIKDAIITNAKIFDLSAAKLIAGTALAGSITVAGTALADTTSRASDPAARVNTGTTKIKPGQIEVAGSTTLADWRFGGDVTKINGGSIAANTISANVVTIGLRGVSPDGIEFEANSSAPDVPAANRVSWTAGRISYTDNDGTFKTAEVSAGNLPYVGSPLYIFWTRGETQLRGTQNLGFALQPENVVLATYAGGIDLTINYGKTIIDGSQIKTGSIEAKQIKAQAIESNTIAALAINAGHVQSNAITTRHIQSGSVTTALINVRAIDGTRLAPDAVANQHIQPGSISGDVIPNGGIVNTHVAINAIDGTKITSNSIQTQHVVANAITAEKIRVNTIVADHIIANQITTSKINGNAVTSAMYATGSNVSQLLNVDQGLVYVVFRFDAATTNGSTYTVRVQVHNSVVHQETLASGTAKMDFAIATIPGVVGNIGIFFQFIGSMNRSGVKLLAQNFKK